MANKYEFTPNKTLFQLTSFRVALFLPAFIAFVLALFIGLNSKLVFDFSYKGFNFLFEVYRVPLAIITLIIPAVAIVVYNHRSEQTQKAILIAEAQNNFANHLAHKKAFLEFIATIDEYLKKSLPDNTALVFVSPLQLYSKLFPGNAIDFNPKSRALDGAADPELYLIRKRLSDIYDELMEEIRSVPLKMTQEGKPDSELDDPYEYLSDNLVLKLFNDLLVSIYGALYIAVDAPMHASIRYFPDNAQNQDMGVYKILATPETPLADFIVLHEIINRLFDFCELNYDEFNSFPNLSRDEHQALVYCLTKSKGDILMM